MLDWFVEQNRYCRVRTHVIAFGTLGVNEKLLAKMASGSWGRFVQLSESTER